MEGLRKILRCKSTHPRAGGG